MNMLPPDRQVINGRTFGQSWERSSMDPITHYRAPLHPSRPTARTLWACLAVVVVMLLAATLSGCGGGEDPPPDTAPCSPGFVGPVKPDACPQ